MIVELFGPAAAGKTTFAHALCARLRDHGHTAEVMLSYRPGTENSPLDPGGAMAALRRVLRGIVELMAMMVRPIVSRREFSLAFGLIRTLPPRNPVWLLRLGQYIVRLGRYWDVSSHARHIVIFDQAFVQAACSLAMHNKTATDERLDKALDLVPQADLLIRLDAPEALLLARLKERRRRETLAERVFEADAEQNLSGVVLTERVARLLAERGREPISLESHDRHSLDLALDRAEAEIVTRLPAHADETELDKKDGSSPQPVWAGVGGWLTPAPGEGRGAWAAVPAKGVTFATLVPVVLATASVALTYLVQFVAARLIGAQSYGVFSSAFACVMLLAYASALGFNVAQARTAPAYAGQGGGASLVGQGASRQAILSALGIAAIGATGAAILAARLRPELIWTGALGLAAAPLLGLLVIGGLMIRHSGGVFGFLAPDRVIRDGLALGLIVTLAWGQLWPRDATLVMGATLVGSAMALGVLAVVLRDFRPQLAPMASARSRVNWWGAALPLLIMAAAETLLNRTGTILLGLDGNMREAGIFDISFSLASLTTLPLMAVSMLFSTFASHLDLHNRRSRLQSLFSEATGLSFVGATLVALPLLVFARPIVGLLGSDFEQAVPIVRILVLGHFFTSVCGPQQAILVASGHGRAAATMLATTSAVNVVTVFVATRLWGLHGAAVATALTLIGWNLVQSIFLQGRLRIAPGIRSAFTWARMPKAADGRALAFVPFEGSQDETSAKHRSYRDSHTAPGYARYYERTFAEGYYAQLWRDVERPLVRAILSDLAGRGASRSLDFACGTGRILALHGEVFDDVVGNDISPEMLGVARRRCPDARIVEGDLTRQATDAVTGGRQVCTAFRFFLNAEPTLRHDALAVLRERLEPGGALVANFHGNTASPTGLIYRIRNRLAGRTINNIMSRRDAEALLDAHGFSVEAVYWYGLWPRFGWRFDRLNRLLLGPAESLASRVPALRKYSQIFIIVARRR
jgi:O-antigen/teichoic acid export membrane protein/SAM-dependent methyltransferase/thymidylate kinase